MLLYLYGIVPADAPPPPPELRGLDGGPVRLLVHGSVAGLVGEVSDAEYGGEVLDARLADLDWVGERGLAHDEVLTWYVDRGPVVPLRPFSLHQSADALRKRLAEAEDRFRAVLGRLSGRKEWGVKLWAIHDRVSEHLAEISPPVQALTEEARGAAPGRRFLLERKLEALVADELRASSLTVARHVYETLAEQAESAARLAIAPPERAERFLVLHACFLVPDDEYEAFQERVSEVATRYGEIGFECEFTGPWPPYHFAIE